MRQRPITLVPFPGGDLSATAPEVAALAQRVLLNLSGANTTQTKTPMTAKDQ